MIATAHPISARLTRPSPARQAALIFVLSGIVFVATDSMTKSLVAHVPVVHVVLGRHVSYLVAVLLIFGRRHPGRLLATGRPWTQLARGVAMFGATATFFLSLSLLPIAEVSALASTPPLIVVLLAGPVLGERVSRAAVGGALVGFAGVLILVGVDTTELDVAMLVPLATALSYALFSLLTRALSDEPAEVTVFISGLVGLASAFVLELAVPTDSSPTALEWAGTGMVGLSALLGHRLLVAAYQRGRASDLAPLGYLSLVWSFAAGAIVFGEAILARAVAGAATIALGGVIALRSGATAPIGPDSPVAPVIDEPDTGMPGGPDAGTPGGIEGGGAP